MRGLLKYFIFLLKNLNYISIENNTLTTTYPLFIIHQIYAAIIL